MEKKEVSMEIEKKFQELKSKGEFKPVVYSAEVLHFEDNDDSECFYSDSAGYAFDFDEAWSICDDVCAEDSEYKAEKGEYLKVEVFLSHIEREDWDKASTFNDLMQTLDWEPDDSSSDDYVHYIGYDYDNIEGTVYVIWKWVQHVGYARKFMGLGYGNEGETEHDIMTFNEERVGAVNMSILVWEECMELDNYRNFKKQLFDKITLHLFSKTSDWKWTNSREEMEKAVRDFIDEITE